MVLLSLTLRYFICVRLGQYQHISTMTKRNKLCITTFLFAHMLLCSVITGCVYGQKSLPVIAWPQGKQIAVSITFDDARASQVDVGTALLDKYDVKATFFVVPGAVKQRLEGWKKATATGHEIGNHSLIHPCSGNFLWAREKALENYTVETMRSELARANSEIQTLLGVTPQVFAYPCGQSFVGRGKDVKSYVPLIAEMFMLGRGWLDEGANDPTYCDFAQLTGIEMDGKDFSEILPILQSAKANNLWVVLAGHEMGEGGAQTTRLSMLKELIEYSKNPANGIWLAPIGTVAKYVQSKR
jgi:peptidoglycan/xylan/chitin deacetylase (PgdA/CDA1 family)